MSGDEAPKRGASAPRQSGRESLFSTRNVVAVTVGTALYALLAIPFNLTYPPGSATVAINPSAAVPVMFGIAFGPLAGFFSGLLGSVVSHQISYGYLLWNWEIGNGLIGLIASVGYYAIGRTSWTRPAGLAATAALGGVAALVGVGFAAVIDSFRMVFGAYTAMAEFLPAATTDIVNGAVLAPILLYAYASLAGRETDGSMTGVAQAGGGEPVHALPGPREIGYLPSAPLRRGCLP